MSKDLSSNQPAKTASNIEEIPQLSGAYHFPALMSLGLKNYFTYDHTHWGNMNPIFAKTSTEEEHIKRNESKLAEYIGSDIIYIMTTPKENTIIYLSESEHAYLSHFSNKRYINLHANSVILPRTLKNYHIVFAPADCAIVVIISDTQIIAMHIGAKQVLTNLHYDTLKMSFLKEKLLKIFIFPYICGKHYSIKIEKLETILNIIKVKSPARAKLIEKYLGSQIKSYDSRERKLVSRIYFDFVGLFKQELQDFLQNHYGIKTTFYETDICTYEHAIKYNNLFSYTAYKEGKQKPGCFNVGFGTGPKA